MLSKKDLSERDICTKYITPALETAGWNKFSQFLEEVSFTDGKIYVKGKLTTRGKAKRADYILYYKPNIPIAIVEPFLDNRPRMRFAQGAQYVRGALAFVALFSYGLQYQLLRRAQLGVAVTPAAADANDWRVQVVGGFQLVVALLAFVAFVQWFYRAYQNTHRLPRARPDYRSSMAAWCWFIPVINLWYPYKIMVEIGHYLGRFTHSRTQVLSSRWDYLVVGWWVLNTGLVLFSRLAVHQSRGGAHSLAQLLDTTRVLMVVQIVTLLSVGVTLALLKTLAPHEQALLAAQPAVLAPAAEPPTDQPPAGLAFE